eukprot:Pgem_evm1s5751
MGCFIFKLNQLGKQDILLIDIEKAFDKIWHKGLLYKLSKFGIPDYLGHWIENYLANRTYKT